MKGSVLGVVAALVILGSGPSIQGAPQNERRIKLHDGRTVVSREGDGWVLVAVPKGATYSVTCKCAGKASVSKVCSAVKPTTICSCDDTAKVICK